MASVRYSLAVARIGSPQLLSFARLDRAVVLARRLDRPVRARESCRVMGYRRGLEIRRAILDRRGVGSLNRYLVSED
jgi:hypothetical protein